MHASVPEQRLPVQQGIPSPPQPAPLDALHRPSMQTSSAEHSLGGLQHGSPSFPHGVHIPPTHTRPLRHWSSAQHASSALPQSPAGRSHWPVVPQRRSAQQSAGARHELPSGAQHPPPTQSKSPQQSSGPVQRAPPGVAQQVRSAPQRVPGRHGVEPMQQPWLRSPQSPVPPPPSRRPPSVRPPPSREPPASEVPPPGLQEATGTKKRAKKRELRKMCPPMG